MAFLCFKKRFPWGRAPLHCFAPGGRSRDTWRLTQSSCRSQGWIFEPNYVILLTWEYVLCSQLYATASRIQSRRRCCLSSLTDVQQLLKDRRGNTTSIPTLNSCHPHRPKGRVPSHKALVSADSVFTVLQKVKRKCEGWKKKRNLNCCKYLGVVFWVCFVVLFFSNSTYEWTLFCNW